MPKSPLAGPSISVVVYSQEFKHARFVQIILYTRNALNSFFQKWAVLFIEVKDMLGKPVPDKVKKIDRGQTTAF